MPKALSRRLASLAARLQPAAPAPRQTMGLDAALAALEKAADDSIGRIADLSAAVTRTAAALERVASGVIVCNEKGDIVERNAQAAAFIGARHGEALAEKAITEALAQAIAGIESRQTLDLFGPPRRSLVIAAFPLHEGQRIVGAVATVDDITERRRLEAVRRDFVSNISHELKTPVGALGLLAETMLDEPDIAVVRRLANRMHGEALRVGRIIEDLLDLSRIEAEESPRREAVPVSAVVADAVERARSGAEFREIAVVVGELPGELAIVGDRTQLVSAVHNLLENAVKYSDRGGAVEVAAAEVTGPDGEPWAEISVCDHGIGIPARDLERIFERFYRVDRARARDTGGTGLGLAIVRHVAGNHGGEVRVSSREGEGSTFVFRIPAGPAGVAMTIPPAASASTAIPSSVRSELPHG